MREGAWAAVSERLERWREALDLPGVALGLVERDGEERIHLAGRRSLATGEPVTADTVFPIGSLTKGFTAALAAGMARDGLLAWDDPVAGHLPELAPSELCPDGPPLTVRHLLCHQSGLGSCDLLYTNNRLTPGEIVSRLAEVHARPAGGAFAYGNEVTTGHRRLPNPEKQMISETAIGGKDSSGDG